MYLDELLVLVLGACIGSFLNVCIYRIPKNESVVTKSSHCYSCGHVLGWGDLIPIISYILLKGRCRYCSEKFSLQYLLVELSTGLLYLSIYNKFGYDWITLLFWALFSVLLVVTVIDIHYFIIPNEILITGLVIGLIIIVSQLMDRLFSGIIGFFIAGLIMLLIAIVSKGGMGGGDIKLSAVMGLYLGWQGVLVALFIAFLCGGIWGSLLLLTGRKGRKDAVPFGPYLALGGAIAALWAQELLAWYMTTFGMVG